jgi:beta-galactosidase
MRFGADYYPEHWPEERWAIDAEMMREAGFNVVRMAEFAWAKLEPEEGTYDFDWLDRAVGLLGKTGIATVLGTPTAIPPDWLTDQHPEILPHDSEGKVRRPGTRRHYRPGSEIYRGHCARIVRVMAAHYSSNANVIGWQIDNEFGCHSTTYEYGPESRVSFQRWLRTKYGSLAELNRRWGTVFWSQTFHTWDAIPLPWYAPADHNPALALDFRRWASEAVGDFQRMQVEILRRANPDWFVTHNFMGLFDEVDGERLCRDLDFASWDNYPITTWGGGVANPAHAAFAHDVTRGFKRRPFWVMEQQAGPTGAGVMSPTPRPGQISFLAWQAIAHGADGMVFFRWRTCPYGAEQYWHGILDHDGVSRRRYREVAGMGRQLAQCAHWIAGSTVLANVALLRDFESCWAYRIQEQAPGFSYDAELGRYHAALRAARLTTDVISPGADFAGYRAIFAPCLHLVTEEVAERLREFVLNGGILVGAFRFGVKDEDNRVVERPLPGLLADVFGVHVEEYDPMGGTYVNRIDTEPTETGTHLLGGIGYEVDTWADILQRDSDSATVLARYALNYYDTEAAITLNKYGKGEAMYVGTSSHSSHFYNAIVRLVAERTGLTPIGNDLTVPANVEVTSRVTSDGRELLFVLNGRNEPAALSGTQGYVNLLADEVGRSLEQHLVVPGWGVAILTRE